MSDRLSKFFRVARSVAIVAGVWAIGWSVLGLAFGIVMALIYTVGFAAYGFAAGAIFSIALALLEYGAPADELSGSRVALAGAIGGAFFPLGTALSMLWNGAPIPAALFVLALFAGLGVATALGTLRLLRAPAQRETDAPREALPRA
jgi:hypothetical protein